MPTGIIINTLAIAIGGVLGTLFGSKLSEEFKAQLNMIFGLASMGMGISSMIDMAYMPAVIFSVVIGTAIGLATNFGKFIERGAGTMSKVFQNQLSSLSEKEFMVALITVIVLFCASGTGIYGSLVNGMTGDSSILISKSILDLFTAAIFACSLGFVVSAIAIPQFIIFMALFLLAKIIMPYTTPDMINDFRACGGLLMIATGFRILGVKMFPTADMIPAMIIVMPISWIWANLILPLL
ncbi:DUF554 domain-containing protein [Streptococcus loxodontisalivarius]|uniref:Membrane protein YqgA involved in biofilm formation n=1 Tax=Streptococcus loxodontisalivarius TaxID=1349415 RepID=A0ABS2PSU9_9STRE|nr:DUF554 domain-containing protein [Streptococcus loxodontisalivarius]MBM7642790.1 putative membrane protein YqgA involved in biofilm formation [Streptococcus loxodontisalivarius]